jgi:hypothetical protein
VRSESYNGVDVVERFIGVSAPDARDRDGKWLEVRAPEAPPTPRRSCSDRAAFHRGASAGADVWWHVACHDASASFRRGGARANCLRGQTTPMALQSCRSRGSLSSWCRRSGRDDDDPSAALINIKLVIWHQE